MVENRNTALGSCVLVGSLLYGLALCLLLLGCQGPPADGPRGSAAMRPPDIGIDAGLEAFLTQFDDKFGEVLEQPEQHRLQLLVSVIEDGRIERYGYRLDAEYFYPASTVKAYAAAAALEWIDARAVEHPRLDMSSPMVFHPLFDGEEMETAVPSNTEGGAITIEHLVREIFLVSDNQAYNWLYELIGQEELNQRLWRAGFESARLHHRLSEARSREDNRRSPRIEIQKGGGEPLVIEERTATLELDNLDPRFSSGRSEADYLLGKAHYAGDQLVDEPLDFRYKNEVSLRDLQDLMIMLLRPDVTLEGSREPFRLSTAQRNFLSELMPLYPRQSTNPLYDPGEYPDDFVKYLLPGLERVVPKERLRIYNKVGLAYGFAIENAMVKDVDTGKSFFVSGVVYSNPNQTLNDDTYGYDEVSLPFFADLGEVLAREFFLER